MEDNNAINNAPNLVIPVRAGNNKFAVLEEEDNIAALETAIERNQVAQRTVQESSPYRALLNTTIEVVSKAVFSDTEQTNT